jgi:hypothetical protein
MAFLVRSAGVTTDGTTGNDFFTVDSAAFKQATINGFAGNDTIEAIKGGTNGTSTVIDAAGGADLINVSGVTVSAGNYKAGAGGDKLNFSAVSFIGGSQLFGGDGNDTITTVNGDFKSATITLGAGADSATFDADIDDASIAFGAGADKFAMNSGAVNSATVIGGGGADSITFAAAGLGAVDHLLVNGDSSVNGGGNDSITFSTGVGEDSTIKGKGGKDIISLVDMNGVSSQVLGNAGADSIALSKGISGGVVEIGGGSGNDTITMFNVNTDSTIRGGGGKDSISIDVQSFVGGTGNFVVFGGAGADTIGLGDVFASGTTNYTQIGFGALSDSTLKTLDVYSAGSNQSGYVFDFEAASAEITSFSTGEVLAANAGIATTETDGIIADASFETAGLTARVVALDASVTKKGSTVAFLVGSDQYIFIQGGTSGTDDDFLADVGTEVVALLDSQVAKKITIGNNAV